MSLRSLVALATLVLIPVGAVRAQRADNPHGPSIGPCATCHAPDSWRPVRISKEFRHAERSFPLEGVHARTSCMACHKNLVFDKLANTCASCHSDVHKGELGTDCARCHTPRSFLDQRELRRMHELTRFPLRGAHAAARCDACHSPATSGQSQYMGRPTTCFGCHAADYRQAKSPDHAVAQFPQDCTACHGNSSWQGAQFDHAVTRFPLTGAHRAVACSSCHADQIYRGKPMACASCHQATFAATTSPPHASAGFPNSCEICHTTSAWTPGTFSHATTPFPLVGAHAAAVCSACHADGVYRGKPTICFSCHQKDYNAVTLPPHASLGYSTVCTDCHTSMTTWQGGVFNHQTFAFPLTGAHLAVSCLGCHADNVFKGKSTACASCHQTSYAATTNPPHAAAGFPATCETCHTTSSWLTATFSHAATRFPLTGAHLTVACSSCHSDGVYHGKTMVCSGCHLATYGATTNPSHSAAGFPTNCESCHTTTTWLGATFNHDASFFPIYSGTHRGRWSVCADCHTTPTNYVVFSCFQCHLKAQMDSRHQGRSGYRYDSPTCYSCHPRGSAG